MTILNKKVQGRVLFKINIELKLIVIFMHYVYIDFLN